MNSRKLLIILAGAIVFGCANRPPLAIPGNGSAGALAANAPGAPVPYDALNKETFLKYDRGDDGKLYYVMLENRRAVYYDAPPPGFRDPSTQPAYSSQP